MKPGQDGRLHIGADDLPPGITAEQLAIPHSEADRDAAVQLWNKVFRHWQGEDMADELEDGLLGDWYTPRMRREDAQRRAIQAEVNTRAAADAARLEARLNGIRQNALAYLADQIAELKDKSRTTPRQRRTYMLYRQYCAEQRLPETSDEALFEFLTSESHRGLAHVSRLLRAIDAVQRSIGVTGSADSLIIKALVRSLQKDC